MAFDATAFAIFFATTTAKTLTGPGAFVNEVLKQDYITSILARSQPMARTLQGGTHIQDYIIGKIGNSRQRYSPDGNVSYPDSQNVKSWRVPWSFTAASVSFYDHEIDQQIPEGMGEDGAMAVFKRVRDLKLADLWTQILEGEEADALAVPNAPKMELTPSGTPQEPYSLFVFNNEFANGLFPAYTPGGIWTTVQQIAPATDPYWVPAQATYRNDIKTLAVGLPYDLFRALDNVHMKTKFKQAPLGKDYGEYKTKGSGIITTDSVGKLNYQQGLLRSNNILLAGRQDPAYPSPTSNGAEVMYVPGLDTAPVYPNAAGTALVSSQAATVFGYPATGEGAPRYHGWQGEYLAPIWNSKHYFDMKPAFRMNETGQFWRTVQPVDTWKNTSCRSRRHQWTVYPGAVLGT